MDRFFQQLVHWFNHTNERHWLLVLVGVILIGVVCLRGFGSRSEY